MDDKLAIARALRETGLLLKLQGGNRFRSRAYEMGARAVEELRDDLETLIHEKRLTAVPGIGPALAGVIAELFTTGRSGQLERLRRELPTGALELAEVPGLTYKRIQVLFTALGIDHVAALKSAATKGQLVQVKGFGLKTQQKILDGIARWERRDERIRMIDAVRDTEPLADYLQRHSAVQKLTLAGALRRFCETVTDAVFVAQSEQPGEVLEHLANYPRVVRTASRGDAEMTVRMSTGLYVKLHVAAPADFAAMLWRLTGSDAHVEQLQALAVQKQVRLLAPAWEV